MTGAACAQSLAVIRLCLLGLDSQARTLVRSLSETLNTTLVLLADRELADAFKAASDYDAARALWSRHFARGRLQALVDNIQEQHGMPEDIRGYVADWRAEEAAMASQTVHVSYIGAVMASMPRMLTDPSRHEPGIFGLPTTFSHRTLRTAAIETALFARPSYAMMFLGGIPFYALNEAESFDSALQQGFEGLPRTVFHYWMNDPVNLRVDDH
jgi:hypothetical protein